jgi:putative drug exporter of the RND superfamily
MSTQPHHSRVANAFGRLGRFTVRFRWLILVFWFVLAGVASHALPSLGSEINNNNSQFLPANAPSEQAAVLATPLLGDPNTTSQVNVVAARASGTLSASDVALVQQEATALKKLPRVTSVQFIGLSHDRVAAQLLVNSNVNQADITTQKTLIDRIQHSFGSLGAPAGLSFHVAGPVAANVANQDQSQKTGNRVQGISALLIIILLLVIFRSILAPLVTLFPPVMALLVSERFIGGLGAHGLKISEITELLLIVLLLGAGTDYGLFLVFRVREEIRMGRTHHEAVAHALERVGESISASGLTVIFALLTLLFASFGIYKDLGIPLAIGVAVMLCAGLTLLPALLAILGRAVFWPSRVLAGQDVRGWWSKATSRLLAHPARTLTVGVLCFAGLACAALSYQSGGFGGAVTAPSGTDAASGDAIVAAHFSTATNDPTNLVFAFATPIWDHPDTLVTIEQKLQATGYFRSIDGPLNAVGSKIGPSTFTSLHQILGPASALPSSEPASSNVTPELYNAYRATTFFVSSNGKTIQFEASLNAGNTQSNAAIHVVPKLRTAVTAIAHDVGATNSGVAGTAPALYDVSSTSNADLIRIIPIAIIAIGILLGLVLRSAVAPLYLIVSVGLSYFAALGISVIVFMDIGGETGLTFILPFLMFIFLLALGEDYNILVMTRIREEAPRFALKDAVTHAVERTGTTITSAGVVLAGTFAVFAFAGSSGPGGGQIRAIGFGLAIGILMDTFVVRTVLVPATVTLLGRWNWWPSRLSRTTPTET